MKGYKKRILFSTFTEKEKLAFLKKQRALLESDQVSSKEKAVIRSRIWRIENNDKDRELHRNSYRRRKKSISRKSKLKREALRLETIEAYGGICKYCGETIKEYLEIDHIDNNIDKDSKGRRIAGDPLYRTLKSLGYPKKNYRLLCANCNKCRYRFGDKKARELGNAKRKM